MDERLVVGRGILWAVLHLDQTRALQVVNIHPTAGGFLHAQDAPPVVAMRQRQIGQALSIAEQEVRGTSVILGDFNAGPEIAPSNYSFLLDHGFTDAYAAVCQRRGEQPSVTWEAGNVLNMRGTHSRSISQRIDHVYVAARESGLRIIDARIVLKDAVVPVGMSNERVTVSDHYGVAVTLGSESGYGQSFEGADE